MPDYALAILRMQKFRSIPKSSGRRIARHLGRNGATFSDLNPSRVAAMTLFLASHPEVFGNS
jgi:hypothetical protein